MSATENNCGFLQIYYYVTCASDRYCTLIHPEKLKYATRNMIRRYYITVLTWFNVIFSGALWKLQHTVCAGIFWLNLLMIN